MQQPTRESVLGNFADTRFTHHGVTTRFFQRGERCFVETPGPDGKQQTYPVRYTFGARPLQQYLLPLPGGRLQALDIAWDSRPKSAGGQRWFQLDPDRPVRPGNAPHWTGRQYNWNHMCASCHSTGLVKGYDAVSRTYKTTSAELDVSCEACHGKGSRHVAWARGRAPALPRRGLSHVFGRRTAWSTDPGTGKPRARGASRTEVESCAPCHSRRKQLQTGSHAGRPLLEGYQPALLRQDLYHADGQISDEVFVYGSFVQSKMYHAGVTCRDCHDPHSLKLRAEGNALCAPCHSPATYDRPSHHFHQQARCVDCHMPARTYMRIDPRRDHSLRVPRPDLSARIGAPDACTGCHVERSQRWAAQALAQRGKLRKTPHYGDVLHAGRAGLPGATQRLIQLIGDPRVPGIARASAVALLGRRPSPGTGAAVERAASDPDPLVRMAAARALRLTPPARRDALARALLRDPLRGVRIEIARQRGLPEYARMLARNADRPEGLLNLGLLHQTRNERKQAIAAYRSAIAIDPGYYPAGINLANLLGPPANEQVLRRAVRASPGSAAAHHALGLLLIRSRRSSEALASLERAARLAPGDARYPHAFALALQAAGRGREAIAVLRKALARQPNDERLLYALATLLRDGNDRAGALPFARQLTRLAPWNTTYRALHAQLEKR